MEQSSWVANSHSASQEIARILWKPKVHVRVQNSLSLVPILSQMHPFRTFPSCFLNVHFNIILSPTPSGFQIKNLHAPLLAPRAGVAQPVQLLATG
jgi:hypothetical protein